MLVDFNNLLATEIVSSSVQKRIPIRALPMEPQSIANAYVWVGIIKNVLLNTVAVGDQSTFLTAPPVEAV